MKTVHAYPKVIEYPPPCPFEVGDDITVSFMPSVAKRDIWFWTEEMTGYVLDNTEARVVGVRHTDRHGWIIETDLEWNFPPEALVHKPK